MFNQMRPRSSTQGTQYTPADNQDVNAVLQGILAANQAAINASTEATNKLVAAMLAQNSHQYSFSKYPVIDLTVAHTNLEITVIRPVSFIQVWSDGGLDGISVRIGQQSNEPIDFRQMQVIPVVDNPEKIYFTNDVRQGRSKAVIYFVQGPYPLSLAIAGQDISQAELAVRNGSIHSFDRRGDIVWSDDFEENIKKWILVSGTAALTTDYAKNGASSCALANIAGVGAVGRIDRYLSYPNLSRYGFEISFTQPSANVADYFMYLSLYTGTRLYEATLFYVVATGVLSVRTPAGYVALGTIPLLAGNDVFNVVKMVADFNTKRYVRVILNNNQFEIPNYDIYNVAAVTVPYMLVSFLHETNDALVHTSYLDNAIVTMNEV
jgi:hypothetical protein